jgi:hypothetical protein
MLNLEVLCEARRADLWREAARDRLASEAAPRSTWRGTLSQALRAMADWIEPAYASPRASKVAS